MALDEIHSALKKIGRGTAADKLESQTLEFKTVGPVAKQAHADIAEAAVCFANAVGGTVVVGVRDTPGGRDAFVGCPLEPSVLRQRVHELTEPHLTVEVSTLVHEGATLLLVSVPEGLEVYGTSKGVSVRRMEDRCRPMRPDEVMTVAEERRGVDWTRRTVSRSIDDIEPRAVDLLRSFVVASGRAGSERVGRLEESALLHELGLAERGRLTKAAELLLCRRAEGVADDVVVYQHRPTPGGEADAAERWGTPLLEAYDETMATIRARQRITPVTLASGVQMQVQDFPTVVVREALVNALVHGDHRYREPIRIVHSSDSLRITSPGPLVSGVTTETILTRGRARFPLLAAAFRRLGLAEDLGQGVDRMYRDMIKNGRDVPSISERSESVEVALSGGPPNRRVTQFVQSLPPQEQDDTDCLLVLVLLCDRRTVGAGVVATVVQRSVEDAERLLHRLATGPPELLEPTSGTVSRRHPNYRLRADVLAQLGPAVRYHRRSRGELDRKVIAHVAEYGYINNSTLQRLFDIDVYQARDLLQDLVGRELLVRTSTQTRGKAVRYGAGPGFPNAGRS